MTTNPKKRTFKEIYKDYQACTNCYGETTNWHLYKGYYWCDGCDHKKLYRLFINKGLLSTEKIPITYYY